MSCAKFAKCGSQDWNCRPAIVIVPEAGPDVEVDPPAVGVADDLLELPQDAATVIAATRVRTPTSILHRSLIIVLGSLLYDSSRLSQRLTYRVVKVPDSQRVVANSITFVLRVIVAGALAGSRRVCFLERS